MKKNFKLVDFNGLFQFQIERDILFIEDKYK